MFGPVEDFIQNDRAGDVLRREEQLGNAADGGLGDDGGGGVGVAALGGGGHSGSGSFEPADLVVERLLQRGCHQAVGDGHGVCHGGCGALPCAVAKGQGRLQGKVN